MRGIYGFLRSTIVGGLVVLVPVIVVVAIIAWAIETAIKTTLPVVQWLPDKTFGGVSMLLLGMILGAIGVCFVAGLFAETTLIRALSLRAERFALSVPGYALMKNVGADFVGIEGAHKAKTVLVQFEESWQLGFLMETLADGRHLIFVPGVPRALVGTLHIFAADRVEILTMSVATALEILGRIGVGFRDSWNKDV